MRTFDVEGARDRLTAALALARHRMRNSYLGAFDRRAALAGELLASLEGTEVDRDREALWAAEIRRRVDSYERGEVKALSADQVLADLRAVARDEKP